MIKNIIVLVLIKKTKKYLECVVINNEDKKIITSMSTREIKKRGSKNNTKSAKVLALNILRYIKRININKIIIKKNKGKYHGKMKKISEIIKNKKYNEIK